MLHKMNGAHTNAAHTDVAHTDTAAHNDVAHTNATFTDDVPYLLHILAFLSSISPATQFAFSDWALNDQSLSQLTKMPQVRACYTAAGVEVVVGGGNGGGGCDGGGSQMQVQLKV